MKEFKSRTILYKSLLSPAGILRAGFFALLLFSLISLLLGFFPKRSGFTVAGADEDEKTLNSISYLDFTFVSPTWVYADEDVVAVADGERTVFFYDGKIYIKKIKVAGNILRNGNYLYYSKDNVLGRVEIGEFVHGTVSDADDNPIGSNGFAFSGEKLISLTNTGMNYYEGFVKKPLPYEFDAQASTYLPLAKVCFAGDTEYFFIDGNLYEKNRRVCIAVADYAACINGEPYFTNADGIFRFDGNEIKCVVSLTDGSAAGGIAGIKICGLSELNGEIIFVNATDNKLMICGYLGENLRDYLFDVKIPTDAKVEFSEAPDTVKVAKGASIHDGILLDGGVFDYDKSAKSDSEEDFVKLSETEGYAVLYGKRGFCLTAISNVTAINENTAITREKGYIIHECSAYLLPVADGDYHSFPLKKGEEVSVLAKYEMNGITYLLIENQNGEKAFTPGGEMTRELLPPTKGNSELSERVTNADYTVYAVVVILLGAAVFTLALFLIFSKKKSVKL